MTVSPSDKSTLPVEVLENIMVYMTLTTLSRSMLVNRHWYKSGQRVQEKNHLWVWDDNRPIEYRRLLEDLYLSEGIYQLQLNLPSWDAGSLLYQNCSYMLVDKKYRDIKDQQKDSGGSNSEKRGFLRELIIHCHSSFLDLSTGVLPSILTTHASTLTRLEISFFGPGSLNLRFILETLTQLQTLSILPIDWHHNRPTSERLELHIRNPANEIPGADLVDPWNDYWEVTRWMGRAKKFSNIRHIDFIGIKGSTITSMFPNIERLRLLDTNTRPGDGKWSRKCAPHLKHLGISHNPHSLYGQQQLIHIIRTVPNIKILEISAPQLSREVLFRAGYHCKLRELNLSMTQFTMETNDALFDMLCTSVELRRLIAPLASLRLQYAKNKELEGIALSDRLESLTVGFDCSIDTEDNVTTLDSSHTAKASSGDLLRYLSKCCPRLSYLRTHIKPQLDLGINGLKHFTGLNQLEELDILLDRLEFVDANSIEWLQHESLDALNERYSTDGNGYYWPRLEKITISSKEIVGIDELRQIIKDQSLRFSFNVNNRESI